MSALKQAPEVFPAGANANSQLGRLTVTKTLGNTDADADYEQLYAFGGRSMSLLSPNGRIVYDTGDQLERLSATLDAANFNKDNAASNIDNRSDNKGPEPEAVTTGDVGGHTYAFLGAERSGMIYAFDLSSTRARPSSRAGSIRARATSDRRGSSSCRAGTARPANRCCWSPTRSAAPSPPTASPRRRPRAEVGSFRPPLAARR